MSSSNCCFLTCMQISQKAGKVVWYSHLFKNFPQFVVVYTVKGCSVVNEAEVDVFPEFSSFFCDQWMLAIWSLVPLPFSKSSLYIWKFLVQTLSKPSLKDFECYFASMWNKCRSVVVCTCFGVALLWDRNENRPPPRHPQSMWQSLPYKQNPEIRFQKIFSLSSSLIPLSSLFFLPNCNHYSHSFYHRLDWFSSRVSQKWNHTAGTLLRLASFT